MGRLGQWPRLVGAWLIVAGLTVAYPGVARAGGQAPQQVQDLAQTRRDRVHVFLVNGVDLLNAGNMTGLRDFIRQLGFVHVHEGQVYDLFAFQDDIRRLHREEPDAHIVLIGFSLGANVVHEIASGIDDNGAKIDLMVYLSGNHVVMPLPRSRPANVGRVLNLLAGGLMEKYGFRDYAENIRVAGSRHFTLPTHPLTLEALERELAAVAGSVVIPMQPPR